MDWDAVNRQRDRRLRKRLLGGLHAARAHNPAGGLYGRPLVDLVDASAAPSDRIGDDVLALGLLRDLVAKGLVAEADRRQRKTQRFGLDYLYYSITDAGNRLWREQAPPDSDIDDERNLEGDE